MKDTFTLGILTLGQSPRTDVEPSLRGILGPDVRFVQRGGLDGLSEESIRNLAPVEGEPGIETCVLRENGEPKGVCIAKRHLLPRLIAAGRELETLCDIFFLLCSGEFPALKHAVPRLIEPITFIRCVVAAVARHSHLCVIGPESDMPAAPAQWQPYAARVSTAVSSPYDGKERLSEAARTAKASGAKYILLDDMGFTEEQRQLVRSVSGIATLNATSIMARALQELM
ncbi:AroM family protein [Pseudodesulfovibrio mercurii]|uniref:AroM family protein n=1 Tax=Pseudodesulfovibrio mercurii TaxID=641491 RepID=F0JK91_9BACT|nr:AroM family protein [Pseudodesulfovibrio mercurii]EGB16340.1 AroM family protein [Pseudodesulfovibrio mercurii]